MTPSNTDSTIRAKLLKTLDRGGFYEPKAIAVDNLVNRAPVPTDSAGRAKELSHTMASDEAEPVVYKIIGESVMLEKDSRDWAMARIAHYDEEYLPWDADR